MTIGVVSNNAFTQPEHFAYTKIILQVLLDRFTRQLRIAIWIQQALLCRQHTAGAVYFNRTAFRSALCLHQDNPSGTARSLHATTPDCDLDSAGIALSSAHSRRRLLQSNRLPSLFPVKTASTSETVPAGAARCRLSSALRTYSPRR